MTDTVDSIYEIINRSKYPNDVTDLYIHNPIIGKVSCWEPLGNKLSANEKIAIANIPSEKYFTIRLDGKNFSSVVPVLVRLGLFSSGYSIEFEFSSLKTLMYLMLNICLEFDLKFLSLNAKTIDGKKELYERSSL